ncbi:MAG: Gfo/Idh/MocA family oxidoreductase [Desulfobacula sp.]|nr:Gfo/Idh/MocA family oxidoreductase [Desulfobacula sp.]
MIFEKMVTQPRVKVGFIGLGPHAEENLLPSLRLCEAVDLQIVSSRSKEKAEKFASKFGAAKITTDWKEMLNKSLIDAVVVSGPPALHNLVAQAALRKGIHVFTEKPVTLGLETLRSLVALAEKNPGVRTFVGYNFRYADTYQSLLQAVSKKSQVISIKVRFLSSKPTESFWTCSSIVESFLYAVGIHAIELGVNLMGKPEKTEAVYQQIERSRFLLNLTLHFPGGRMALLEMGNYSNRFECRYEVLTDQGIVGILDDQTEYYAYSNRSTNYLLSKKEKIHYRYPSSRGGYDKTGYQVELESFIQSILKDTESGSEFYQSVAVFDVIEQTLGVIHGLRKEII